MKEKKLPHNHDQNEEKILEKLPSVEECSQVAEIFKQVGDGTRLRILWFLCHCEECVSNIAAAMETGEDFAITVTGQSGSKTIVGKNTMAQRSRTIIKAGGLAAYTRGGGQ